MLIVKTLKDVIKNKNNIVISSHYFIIIKNPTFKNALNFKSRDEYQARFLNNI